MADELTAEGTPTDNTVTDNEPLLTVPQGDEATSPAEETDPPAEGEAPLLQVEDPAPEEGGEEDGEKPEGAPEAYEPFNVPQGWTLEGETGERVNEVFKELNLTQEAGQKLIDAYIQHTAAAKEQELVALEAQRRAWRAERRQSPTYQSDRALANKGLNAVVKTQEQRDLFNNTWLQDHPAVYGLFVNVGRLLGEDVPLNAGTPTGNEPDSASVRFPVKL